MVKVGSEKEIAQSNEIPTLFKSSFALTAAGVVPCGGPKIYPRTYSIVQFIFSFWSFEISDWMIF